MIIIIAFQDNYLINILRYARLIVPPTLSPFGFGNVKIKKPNHQKLTLRQFGYLS